MTDLLDQAIAQTALDLLAADAQLVTYDGEVPSNPTPTPPYCVVYTTLSRPSDDPDNALDGLSRVWVARWLIHGVGQDADGARAVLQRVRTQLLDVRPTVVGLSCGRIRLDGEPSPPQRDESTGGLWMSSMAPYRLRATS